jgi:hypothetical protein
VAFLDRPARAVEGKAAEEDGLLTEYVYLRPARCRGARDGSKLWLLARAGTRPD